MMASLACSPEVFSCLSLSSINIQALSATPVVDFFVEYPGLFPNHGQFPPSQISFCNVTVTYSHPDEEDYPIVFEAWLPSDRDWNKRLVAIGGSQFAIGRYPGGYEHMGGLVSEGYAALTTDGGVADPTEAGLMDWIKEPGVLDDVILTNWGTEALGDMARIGKAVVKKYYKEPASYSYFSGCSQGGRNGYELAQTYPDAFDGIAAAAPIIKQIDIAANMFWPQLIMYQAQAWPRGCEIDSLTALAVEACDAKDGIEDGVIMDHSLCDTFDPFDHIGSAAIACKNQTSLITEAAAVVVNATWYGMIDDFGNHLAPGLLPGADLSGRSSYAGLAATTCYDTDEDCDGQPNIMALAVVLILSLKDPAADYTKVTLEELHQGLRETKDLLGDKMQSYDPDLTDFRQNGGKLLTWHGLADELMSSHIVRWYYDKVETQVPGDVADFYRFFEIPGLKHCFGPQSPGGAFNALRDWVENGIAPETLQYHQVDAEGVEGSRRACPYPQTARYDLRCEDPNSPECFVCE